MVAFGEVEVEDLKFVSEVHDIGTEACSSTNPLAARAYDVSSDSLLFVGTSIAGNSNDTRHAHFRHGESGTDVDRHSQAEVLEILLADLRWHQEGQAHRRRLDEEQER
jgi:hypothetical protein